MERPLALALAALPLTAGACMGVGDGPVRFAGQTNIVVWDRQRSLEYFVRDARFETSGKTVGFVAPTPTRPSIYSVDRSAFSLVEGMTPGMGSAGGAGGAMPAGGGVSVIERKTVSGFEATVLRADDPEALVEWLSRNGYASPRFASRWAAPYVRRKWYFAAFKVPAGGGAGSTGPVGMTFATKMPYNPYSVPAENTGRGGLSLYYVSNGDERPMVGGIQPWLRPQWSKPLSEENTAKLETALHTVARVLPKGSTVSLYRDEGFGRPGFDDLYFVSAPKPTGDGASANGQKAGPSLASALALGAFAFVRVGRSKG